MRQNLPRNVLTRLEASRVVVYSLVAGGLVGVLGSGLRVVLDVATDALGRLAGFRPPGTPGEGGLLQAFGDVTPWGLALLPVLAVLGLTISGTVRRDPLEEAVRAYHAPDAAPGAVARSREVVGSVLTYLSGLVVGRDGPFTALGNLSSALLGRLARLGPGEARTLSLACVAAGLGMVLHAPIAAAVLMVEVLYRRFEFEVEVLLPAVLASVTAYAIYGTLHGFGTLVDPNVLQAPTLTQVPLYAVLALVVNIAAWLLANARRLLPDPASLRVPLPVLAAVYGLVAAGVALWLPATLGDGTGWWQLALSGFQGTEAAVQGLIRTVLLLGVAWLALGGTVLSSVACGGLIGVGVATALPGWGLDPVVGGLVGAAAFLTTSHNVPVAATLLLATWGGDALLPGLLAATLLAHAVSGEASIVATQRRGRAESLVVDLPAPPGSETDRTPGPEADPGEHLFRLPLPAHWAGIQAEHVVWPEGVQLVAVVRDGDVRLAQPDEVLHDGDELVLLAPPEQIEGLSATLPSLTPTPRSA